EEIDKDLAPRIDGVNQLERSDVAHALDAVDMWAEGAIVVEEMDRLRGDIAGACVGGVRVRCGKEIGAGGDEIEQRHDHHADHGQPVTAKTPPGKLQLAGERVPV